MMAHERPSYSQAYVAIAAGGAMALAGSVESSRVAIIG